MNYLIPQELAQTIFNYLVERPFREVAPMVAGLQAVRPAPELIEPTALTAEPSTV